MRTLPSELPVLHLTARADALRVPPGKRALHVALEVRATDAPPAEGERLPLSAVLALDVSGSMAGPPLAHVIASIDRILEALAPTDRLGIVAFSNGAGRIVDLGALDAAHKRLVRARAARLSANGGTNVEAGLRAALAMLRDTDADRRRAIVLMSDGQPNAGLSSAAELRDLARAARTHASVSALGYGIQHDDAVLDAIADGGGGVYRYVADPAVARLEMAQALGAQADVVAEQIQLVLAPRAGVRIEGFVGDVHPHFDSDGIVVPLRDMVAHGAQIVVARVEATLSDPATAGALLRVKLRWKRPGKSTPHEVDTGASVDVGGHAIVAAPAPKALVLLARVDEARTRARAQADRGQFEGAAAALRAMSEEVDAFLADVDRATLGEARDALEEARELVIDEALAMERRPSAETYATFLKHSKGTSARDAALYSSSKSRGYHARAMGTAAAGNVPEAYLIPTGGPDAGHRHRLDAVCTLGRTASADIVIPSPSVSRRHAEIFVLEGDFWLMDLGSTNVTNVNGRPLGREPHKLAPGDLVGLGGVELRFESPAP